MGSGRMIPYEKWVEPQGTSRPGALPGHVPPTEPKARKMPNSKEQPQGGSSEREELYSEAKEPVEAGNDIAMADASVGQPSSSSSVDQAPKLTHRQRLSRPRLWVRELNGSSKTH